MNGPRGPEPRAKAAERKGPGLAAGPPSPLLGALGVNVDGSMDQVFAFVRQYDCEEPYAPPVVPSGIAANPFAARVLVMSVR